MLAASDFINIALGELGVHEEPPGSNVTKYGQMYGMYPASWCMQYISYVWRTLGLPIPPGSQSNLGWASVGFFLDSARKAGWVTPTNNIQPGDVVCYIWQQGETWPDHVGIVVDVYGDGSLLTVEGNSNGPDNVGDEVARHVRPRSWEILAVVRPPFDAVATPTLSAPPSTPTPRAIVPYLRLSAGVTLLQNGPGHHDLTATYQRRMAARGWTIGVDGQFGPQTHDVTMKYQKEKGLSVDGVVGPQTWTSAWESPVT